MSSESYFNVCNDSVVADGYPLSSALIKNNLHKNIICANNFYRNFMTFIYDTYYAPDESHKILDICIPNYKVIDSEGEYRYLTMLICCRSNDDDTILIRPWVNNYIILQADGTEFEISTSATSEIYPIEFAHTKVTEPEINIKLTMISESCNIFLHEVVLFYGHVSELY